MDEVKWKWLVADVIDFVDGAVKTAQESIERNKGQSGEGAREAFHFALGEKTLGARVSQYIIDRLGREALKKDDVTPLHPRPPEEAA